MQKYFEIILIALISCLFIEWEYGELQLIKMAVAVGFCYRAFSSIQYKNYLWVAVFIFFAIAFLPVLEVKLKRESWQVIDWIAICILLIHLLWFIFKFELTLLTEDIRILTVNTRRRIFRKATKVFGVTLVVIEMLILTSYVLGSRRLDNIRELELELKSLEENPPYKIKLCDYLLNYDYNYETLQHEGIFNYRYKSQLTCLDTIATESEIHFVYKFFKEMNTIEQTFEEFQEKVLSDTESDALFTEITEIKNEIDKKKKGWVYNWCSPILVILALWFLSFGILIVIIFGLRHYLKE